MNEVTRLDQRNCVLEEPAHAYFWDPMGVREQMAVSVTGVTNLFKPPVDYSKYPDAAFRGTHTHLAMEAIANGQPLPDHISPEGVDCLSWFESLCNGDINDDGKRTMADFWDKSQTIAAELTMVSRSQSLGGQLDLIVAIGDKVVMFDLKTKSENWKGASAADKLGYKQQFGGYLHLLLNGDDAKGGCIVDECRTLIITPKQAYILPPNDPDQCFEEWEECWGRYCAHTKLNPF